MARNSSPARTVSLLLGAALLDAALLAAPSFGADAGAAPLPPGVRAVWDLAQAARDATPTRERVCLNGLWRWQPAQDAAETVPAERWGWFKVPGCWPGITDYLQKDCQTLYAHPTWRDAKLGTITTAWYQREFTVPREWAGRRITLEAEYVNSYAAVFVDGKPAGEMRFPAGEVDLTAVCRPGATHTLSLRVVAMPLQAVLQAFRDSNAAREVKGTVLRRGLCGDVYLVGAPVATRVADVKVDTSVRQGEITLGAAPTGLAADGQYTLRAQITAGGQPVQEFTSKPFRASDLKDGRMAFTSKWKPDRLWDVHTPGNQYEAKLALLDSAGKVLDAGWPVRFGFREFWIDGRDFYLNGSRIYLSAVPLDNAQIGAAWATYDAARETLERLKTVGINFVYTHNYDCMPGSYLSFAEILRAADDVGMLVAFSQPHFSSYRWTAPDADTANGYAAHARFFVRVAQNHPAVVFYAMNHNATGYSEDMNPDMIDGSSNPRDQWSSNNVKLALRVEAIVKALDPGRIIYHHSSGNLSSMHTSNFYANLAPVQELSDWFEHWATTGVKPVFTCEYGVPFSWDWTMYRGWYKGKREFGSAAVPWEFCVAEWNAQFFGDRAYQISEAEKANVRWEAQQFRAGRLWHRWDYPNQVGSSRLEECYPVFALYVSDNWRAYRTWGMSANSPWEYGHFWKLRDGANHDRKQLAVDWDHLQRPGFSADYMEPYDRMDQGYERTDWIATPAAQALLRNNQPLLAYLAGKPAAFTSKDHNFTPGQTVEKQLIVINNSRTTVTARCAWSLALPQAVAGNQDVTVDTGQQQRLPLRFDLPAGLAPGKYELTANVRFGTGETQNDTFTLDVLPRPAAAPGAPGAAGAKIALFDPKGESRQLLERLGLAAQPVEAGADLAAYDLLIVGKAALGLDTPAPDLARVRDGLKVIVFEQTGAVLEQRLGFRVAEYGLRQVFRRVPDHPVLSGLTEDQLRNWCGAATILPPQLKYTLSRRLNMVPSVTWCGLEVSRVWRCGNRGNVASALIEKPACGDFLPILDGGYSLQYSPLLEYREGKGMVLFCQVDVTGRTEPDPAADALARNLVQYAAAWKPAPRRQAVYVGEPAGKAHLAAAGVTVAAYEAGKLTPDQVLIVGPGGGKELAGQAAALADWLKAGGHVLAVGLDEQEAGACLPVKVTMKKAEHLAAYFAPPGLASPLAGVSPADVHNRDPREVPLVTSGATSLGDGVLARAEGANIVFCQLAPWQFDPAKSSNLKRTYRRVSCLLDRVLANLGVAPTPPVLARFAKPVAAGTADQRWLTGMYLDQPEEWDDPYRFFRW